MAFRQSALEGMGMIEEYRLAHEFWRGKRVLLTGHTGFKGGWLTLWLHRLGAEITGIGLSPVTDPSLFRLAGIASLCQSHFCDIRDGASLGKLVRHTEPEVVFHLAAQPLVRASYREPASTFAANIMGTVHLLDSLRGLESVRVAVFITTDKVYRNHEWLWPYHEDDSLGGHDPYSASKAASELAIASYRTAFLEAQGVAVASARAGNVLGGGDWSEDRLLPDAVRAWSAGRTLKVRRPRAIRPWQHVLEPLAGYLLLAQKLWEEPGLAGAYNFGPRSNESVTVEQVVELARDAFGGGKVRYGDNTQGPPEAGHLALEIAKARSVLGYRPRWPLPETVWRAMAWYRAQQRGGEVRSLCAADIEAYEAMP